MMGESEVSVARNSHDARVCALAAISENAFIHISRKRPIAIGMVQLEPLGISN